VEAGSVKAKLRPARSAMLVMPLPFLVNCRLK